MAMAQASACEEIAANHFLSGSNHLDYDNYPATATLTKTPKGYEPYYMSHYGRHGSRWLLGDGEYMESIEILRKAKAQGKITNKGNEVLAQLEKFYPCTINRLGDLTTVGERQHHGIGRRMAQHFPEIFKKKGVKIDARSTVVIRCILSMEGECEELAAANPTAVFHNDVSESLQYYLNAPWPKAVREQNRNRGRHLDPLREKWTHPERLMSVLFNDPQWVADSLRAGSFMRHFFNLASNMQSHEGAPDLLKLFTTDELYDQWRIRNVDWYLGYGAAPQTGSIMPFSQSNLLKNIIQTADTVTQVQATLRFGHEVCVMPLACLLELGSCGAKVENLEELDRVWRNYNIFPMACNVQLIFYRPKKGKSGDILVKALLNEREQTLPVQTDSYPYYRWADLRAYYLKKLQDFDNINK
ncbi:MAG: histidine-type phosphatase [Bacteroidaceae bacterium]|nr:histidine-type phosphatase [Bacteroidaceae bacterium]